VYITVAAHQVTMMCPSEGHAQSDGQKLTAVHGVTRRRCKPVKCALTTGSEGGTEAHLFLDAPGALDAPGEADDGHEDGTVVVVDPPAGGYTTEIPGRAWVRGIARA